VLNALPHAPLPRHGWLAAHPPPPRCKLTPSPYTPLTACSVSLEEWQARIPPPVPRQFTVEELEGMPKEVKGAAFDTCLQRQSKDFTDHVLQYRSPRLEEVRVERGEHGGQVEGWRGCSQ
jgi:hypothetical protein